MAQGPRRPGTAPRLSESGAGAAGARSEWRGRACGAAGGGLRAARAGQVEMDEVLCEVETDKVTVEIRAPDAGVIQELCAQEGETILVGADLVKYLKAAPLRSLDPPSPRPATP